MLLVKSKQIKGRADEKTFAYARIDLICFRELPINDVLHIWQENLDKIPEMPDFCISPLCNSFSKVFIYRAITHELFFYLVFKWF